jgi:hypothetical protein
LLSGAAIALLLSGAPPPSPQVLWDGWPARRFVATSAPCLRPAELGERLRALAAAHPGRLSLESVGRSVEGREIQLAALGRGPRRVLLWSQMHGDEPSATPALVDLAHALLASDGESERLILERLTLLLVPMLNPDGAFRYVRRNAQAVDLNRDALLVATPEGRLLKQLRERFEPELGFNLHDQNRRTSVGDTGVRATIALLAVAGDAEGTLTPGRARAKRVCAAVARALAPFAPGGISRYDEDWNPRAFGDNLTAWGTPVVLIESGAFPAGGSFAELTRLNYVALLTALHGLAADDLAGEDISLYEGLARNVDDRFTDVVLEGGRVLQAPAAEPYRADLAFDVLEEDSELAGCPAPGAFGPSRIREVGDARLLGAARRSAACDRLLVPALAVSVRGLAARRWLDRAAIDALSRLGVARLLWHVRASERPQALAVAARLAAPGRAALEVVDAGDPTLALELVGPPRPASSPLTLSAALEALAPARARAPEAARPLVERLGPLTGYAGTPVLRPGARASFLVMRPREAGALEPGALEIETVVLDGREFRDAR